MAPSSSEVLTGNGTAEHALCGWRVQPMLNRLVKSGAELRLEPRIMQVLVCLLAADGEPVTRDELMQRVWGHEHVTEDALNRTVSKLRKLLTEDMRSDATIETIPKTGYRLLKGAGDESPSVRESAVNTPPWRRWWAVPLAALVLALAGLLWSRSTHKEEDVVSADGSARLLPLTTLEGKEIDPTLSPDGSHVAFAWRERADGKYHIYVRPISSETLLQVSQGSVNDMVPAWSPDGAQIAFVRIDDRQCEVLSVSPVGGPTRHLADCDTDEGDILAWSPDGALLAFRAAGSKGIDFLKLADGSVRHFTDVPPDTLIDGEPEFSPDGALLAFARWHAAGVADVFVIPVKGGEPKRLTFDNLKMEGISWEPDSRHLVYSSNRAGPFSLWRVSVDAGAPQRVPVSGRSAFSPMLSRDGQKMVYEEWNGQTDLFSLDTHAAGAAPQQVTFATRWDWNPAVSPDGRRLAFASDRSGSSEIWVSDRDGGNDLKLTAFGGPYTSSPAWSPDGKAIAFDSPAVNGNFDIYVVSADGGAPRRFTTVPAEDRFPHYSADGKWIYFSSRRSSEWEIWRMPAQGGLAEQVTQSGAYYSQPGPDGALYFSRITHPGIWRLAAGGGEPVLVVPELQPEDCSNWRVAADRIWYIQREASGDTFLASHPYAAGGPGTRLIALPLTYKSGLSVSPDGKVLFAKVVRDESDLMLMER
ncbi:MAG TPA: winged helix-turn-helix domain-containing protein [Gammaproteobacteria bacterium]|nr:winged helix-turn-helix domain-containing protein [Gammaproteobacteria bacterium]